MRRSVRTGWIEPHLFVAEATEASSLYSLGQGYGGGINAMMSRSVDHHDGCHRVCGGVNEFPVPPAAQVEELKAPWAQSAGRRCPYQPFIIES